MAPRIPLSTEKTLRLLRHTMMEIILVGLCVFLTFYAPNFLTVGNLMNVLRSVSEQGLIAFGMTMVIVSGEIDLSVGSAVAFCGCATAWLTQHISAWLLQLGAPLPLEIIIPAAILITLALGFGAGAFSGMMRAVFQVPTFITTLALLIGLRGAALLLTGGFPLMPFPQWYNFLGGGYILQIPVPAIVFLAAFVLVHFMMNFTSFGRAVYAVGGNAEAARLSGVNVTMIRILVLAITGMLAAASGVILSARIMSGTPTVAQGWELEVIAAVIIGGTSLTGGVGTVWGTLIGVIFIGVINNGMVLLGVPIYGQYIVLGSIILAAALVNRMTDVLVDRLQQRQ